MITEGIVKRAVRPDLSQLEPRFRDTSPSGIASQPTGNGRPRISRTAHISSGTSIRTTSRFQGSVAPRPKCALVSQAASEIDVAECEELKALGDSMGDPAGQVARYVYLMDADPGELFLVAVFESRQAYWDNAQSPEQHQRYQDLRALLDSDPEWHDGAIIDAAV